MWATSNRQLAHALGVSETAVRKALAIGRISRDADGGFDIPRVKRQWAGNTDAAQQRPAQKAVPTLRPVPAAASVRETLRDHVQLESDMKLVPLYRRDRLAQYASERTAARNGRYFSGDPLFASAMPLAFDRADFLGYVGRQALACGLVRDLIKDPARLFVIEYEEVGTAAANAALLAFLGQQEAPTRPTNAWARP
jgi:hypothetical protein